MLSNRYMYIERMSPEKAELTQKNERVYQMWCKNTLLRAPPSLIPVVPGLPLA